MLPNKCVATSQRCEAKKGQDMSSKYSVEIFYSDEDDGYIARVPELPGCSAWGKTRIEAATEIDDAIDAWKTACMKAGNAIPAPAFRWNSR